MRADLNKTAQFYEEGKQYSLNSQFAPWKEFDIFQLALWELQKATKFVNPGFEVSQILDLANQVKHVLMKSPLDPVMVTQLSELANSQTIFSSGSSLEDRISRIIASAQDLMTSKNPLSEIAESLITQVSFVIDEYGEEVPDIVLVVDRRAKAAVEDIWLPALELEAAVKTAQEARRLSPWGHSILFGNPEAHISTFGQQTTAVRHPANWMISAPAGFSQTVLLTEGCPTFNSVKYAPWRTALPPKSICKVERPGQIRTDIIPEWVPEPPKSLSDVTSKYTGLVSARPILLPSNYWIYFSTSSGFGPKPLVATVVDGEVSAAYSELSNLNPGDFLVIRSARASREYLRNQASEYIDRKHGHGTSEADFMALDQFKSHIREFSLNDFAVQNLVNAGLDRAEARMRINQAWDDTAIAPDQKSDFEKLCQAAGYAHASVSWPRLVRIRTAMRTAGHIAMRELISTLKEDSEWPEIVDGGEMCVSANEDFGEIHIAKILEISNTTQDLHLVSLGKLINPDGTIYEGE